MTNETHPNLPKAMTQKKRSEAPEPGTPAYNRMARRKAVRMGLNPSSGEEAVQMLKDRGFDVTNDTVTALATASGNPVKVQVSAPAGAGASNAPDAAAAISEDERQREILNIQKAMARRRSVRFFLIFIRIAFFVILPTAFAGNYFYNVATEMYEVETQLVIQKAESGGSGGIGGLLAGTGFANSEDSVIVQGYLTSREAMLRLDQDLGFAGHFQQAHIDDIQRLPADASAQDAYMLYKDKVVIGYDPSEGVIRMNVIALDPETATAYSQALISYAEERVDQISAPVRRDQMQGAQENYNAAEQAVLDAQENVLTLQESRGVLSAEAEISGQMSIIHALEVQLEERRLALTEINENASPNSARANAVSAEIDRLDRRIKELRTALTESGNSTFSLARISGELRIAETDLNMRQVLLQQALTQLETARIEANRQVRYLSIAVAPVASDVATHPKKLENTALAFIVFMALYIFLSLTVSILREQIGS